MLKFLKSVADFVHPSNVIAMLPLWSRHFHGQTEKKKMLNIIAYVSPNQSRYSKWIPSEYRSQVYRLRQKACRFNSSKHQKLICLEEPSCFDEDAQSKGLKAANRTSALYYTIRDMFRFKYRMPSSGESTVPKNSYNVNYIKTSFNIGV
jgi:hypothetical protein